MCWCCSRQGQWLSGWSPFQCHSASWRISGTLRNHLVDSRRESSLSSRSPEGLRLSPLFFLNEAQELIKPHDWVSCASAVPILLTSSWGTRLRANSPWIFRFPSTTFASKAWIYASLSLLCSWRRALLCSRHTAPRNSDVCVALTPSWHDVKDCVWSPQSVVSGPVVFPGNREENMQVCKISPLTFDSKKTIESDMRTKAETQPWPSSGSAVNCRAEFWTLNYGVRVDPGLPVHVERFIWLVIQRRLFYSYHCSKIV